MKQNLIFLMLSICFANIYAQKAIPFTQNGKMGFIDETGAVLIPATFKKVFEFSEGLAVARTNGLYGYLNQQGKYVISPQFEVAMPFKEGIAKVGNKGKYFLINQKGETLLKEDSLPIVLKLAAHHLSVVAFEKKRTDYESSPYQQGLLHCSGKWILEPKYYIPEISQGLIVVSNNEAAQALLDTLGNFIIPFGIFYKMQIIDNQYIIAEYSDQETRGKGQVLLDKTGKICLSLAQSPRKTIKAINPWGEIILLEKKAWKVKRDSIENAEWEKSRLANNSYSTTYFPQAPQENASIMDSLMQDSIAKAAEAVAKKVADSLVSFSSISHAANDVSDYFSYLIDLKGNEIVKDTNWTNIQFFGENALWITTNDNKSELVNRKGKPIVSTVFSNLTIVESKHRLLAIVYDKWKQKWGIIEEHGKYLFPPIAHKIIDWGEDSEYFAYEVEEKMQKDEIYPTTHYGLLDATGKMLLPAKFNDLHPISQAVFLANKDEKWHYLTVQGKIIWQEQKPSTYQKLDLTFQNDGYFMARSAPMKKNKDLERYYKHFAFPEKIHNSHHFPSLHFRMVVDTNQFLPFYDDYEGRAVFIYNDTRDTVFFEGQDGRLAVKMQALDEKGEWRDIEYLANSWCGNSYHTLYLKPHHYWQFSFPVYEGEIKTKLRFELRYLANEHKEATHDYLNRSEKVLYSNEFEGTINAAQFWVKREYDEFGLYR